jgi:hypothetical protein
VLLFTSAKPSSIDGVWLTDGYGLLVAVNGSKMNVFEMTSISCLPAWTAELDLSRSTNEKTVFVRERGTVAVMPGENEDRKWMHLDFSVSRIGLRRVLKRPALCDQPVQDTPLNNYAVFWQTFAEQFALFPRYSVNWSAVDREYRARVGKAMPPQDLFQLLVNMVDAFHNAHIDIRAKAIQRDYWGYKPTSDILQTRHSKQIAHIIESRYIQGQFKRYCGDQIQYGVLRGAVGFLRILSFENYTRECLQSALDDIFGTPSEIKGLIIDVRINEGGSDAFGIDIASRLTRKKYFAYSKVARNSLAGPLTFTAPEAIWVEPSSRSGFWGKVVLLAGPDTLSAGETFAMALMNRQPEVIRAGDNTQGVFSDKLRRRLPNGWVFALPNEVYLTKEGASFDVDGVPPHIHVSLFTQKDLEQSSDSGIEKGLEVMFSDRSARAVVPKVAR